MLHEVSLFFAGKKAYEAFKSKGYEGELFEDFWMGTFGTAKSNKVADKFVQAFIEKEVDNVEVIYTEFKSALTQNITT